MTTMLAWLVLKRCSYGPTLRRSSRSSSSSSSKAAPVLADGDGSRRRRRVKHGFGRLVATSDDDDDNGHAATTTSSSNTITRLTTMSHQAPVRLIPLRSTAVSQSGAAVVYLSNYGGGLLSGDVHDYTVNVETGARLALVSQGSNRIYTSASCNNSISCDVEDDRNGSHNGAAAAAQTRITARVAENACFIMAPDPITPFTNSIYRQEQELILHSSSSLVWIDWFSSGRFVNGERWQMQYLQNKTTVYMMNDANSATNRAKSDDHDHATIRDHDERPVLIDCVTLDNSSDIIANGGMDWNNNSSNNQNDFLQINAHASVLLHGSSGAVDQVLARFRQLENDLASPHARIRTTTTLGHDDDDDDLDSNGNAESSSFALDSLSGRVFLGISAVPTGRGVGQGHHHHNDNDDASRNSYDNNGSTTIYVARLAAESNEDLYRIFHYCLKPLSDNNHNDKSNKNKQQASSFGFEFYKDRIRAVHSAPIAAVANNDKRASSVNVDDDANSLVQYDSNSFAPSSNLQEVNDDNKSSWWWSAFLLADSSLPTGSFAHSAGLEVAAQLGLISNNVQNVENYVHAATKSYLQQTAPTVMACHDLTTAYAAQKRSFHSSRSNSSHHLDDLVASWSQWDDTLQLLLVSNTTACRASIEQGQNLLRVALQWAATEENESLEILQALQSAMNNTSPSSVGAAPCWGHLPSIFGVVCAIWQIPRAQAMTLLGYCMARDLVSAAVRLNLVGPLASVGILSAAQKAAMGVGAANKHHHSSGGDETHAIRMASPGTCAPLLDAIQPCHDLLAVRLFRT